MPSNPFYIVDAINKGDVSARYDLDAYNPYLINRQFSYFLDSIFISNELNKYVDLTSQQQFDCYVNSLKPKKRFSKWHKIEENDLDNLVAKKYNVSLRKAKEYISLMNDEEKQQIKKLFNEGGIQK